MAFRSRSLSRPRGRETIEAGGRKLYVETHVTTPQSQHPHHMLALPSLHSTLPGEHVTRMPNISTVNDKFSDGTMMNDVRKERGFMTAPSSHQVPQQQHFFTTPRVVDSGMLGGGGRRGGEGIGSEYGGSALTNSRSEDSRNPPPSIFHGNRDPDSRRDHGVDDNTSYDEFSAKVRSEMKRLQADVRGGIRHLPPRASSEGTRYTRPPTMDTGSGQRPSSRAYDIHPKDTQVNQIHDNQRHIHQKDKRRHLVDENKQLEETAHSLEQELWAKVDRNKGLEERNHNLEQELRAKGSEITELKRQLRSTQQTKEGEISSQRIKMAQTYAQDLKDIECEHEDNLNEIAAKQEKLQEELAAVKEQARDDIREEEERIQEVEEALYEANEQVQEANDEIKLLRNENEILVRGCEIAEKDMEIGLRKITDLERTIEQMECDVDNARRERTKLDEQMVQEANRDIEEKNDEIQLLRNENESLVKGLEIAEKDVEIGLRTITDLERTIEQMEYDFGNARRERMKMDIVERDLGKAQHMVKELEGEIKELKSCCDEVAKDKLRLETKFEDTMKEKTRMEAVYREMKENCQTTLEEKIRYERDNKALVSRYEKDNEALANDLDHVTEEYGRLKKRMSEEYDEMKKRMSEEHDEMEKQLTADYETNHKYMADECDRMRRRVTLMDEMTEELDIALAEKEDAMLRLKILEKENAMLQATKESTLGALERELKATKSALEHELQSTKKMMDQELKSVLGEKEDAKQRYDDLSREHHRLQNTKESESHMTEMIARQRDKMGVMMDKYMQEIEELKGTNMVILRERDDLKDELISVLETASTYQQY